MAVIISDSVNQQGSQFPTEELVCQLERLHARGFPSLISHNVHRLHGWTFPRSIFFRKGSTLLLGDVCYPESKEEYEQLEQALRVEVTRRTQEDGGDAYDRLQRMLGQVLGGDERRIYAEGAALVAPGLAMRAVPWAFERADKDGLVPLSNLSPVAPGVYRFEDICLFAHPFFRRSLSRHNALNEELLQELQSLTSIEEVTGPSVLLDPDMVGLVESVKHRIELQYWWGPRFSNNLAFIPTGVTRHAATDGQRWFSGVSATEFWWHSRDGQHTLEAEELLDVESFASDGVPRYGCRYVHSIIDEASGRIEHLDGAIRGYSDEAMVERIDCAISEAGRRSQYTKLWRLDGRIDLASWKNLIHHYFRDNTLVGEYFAGVDDDDEEVDQQDDPFVPVPFAGCSGLSLLLSLRSHAGIPLKAERSLEPGLTMGKSAVCSVRLVDLHKILVRQGQPALLDGLSDLRLLAHSDMYADLPLVMHSSHESLEGTRQALLELVGAWATRTGEDTIVAANVGLRCKDVDVLLGLLGPAPDVVSWIARSDWFPHDTKIAEWSERAAIACRTTGAGSLHPFHVVASNYRAEFQRVVVKRSFIDAVKVVDGTLNVTYAFPPELRDTAMAVARGELFIRPAYLVGETECGLCGQSYRDCSHIKMIDEGVSMVVKGAELLYFIWTDRPA